MATPPEMVDGSYIQIRDIKSSSNGWNVGGQFSWAPQDYFFPAYVTSFSDEYTSNFNQQNVYGRMDPISTFQNTQRVISLSFMCPAASASDAEYYLNALSALIRSMYPNYAKTGVSQGGSNETSIITAPPMFGVRFGNLIQGSAADNAMLKGVIPALTFAPVLDEGMFIMQGNAVDGRTGTTYLPKTIEISLTFNPLHDFNLGFDEQGQIIEDFQGFPYQADKALEGFGMQRSISSGDLLHENDAILSARQKQALNYNPKTEMSMADPEDAMSQMDEATQEEILSS